MTMDSEKHQVEELQMGVADAEELKNEAADQAGTESAARPDEIRSAADLEYDLIAAVKTVYDPEIPVDIYELGLIYEINVGDAGDVHIVMTLTTPMCPVAEILPPEVEAKAREVAGVRDVRLDLVWEPPWSMDMMSPAARLQLNL
jgi:FeS assembly SUF system protein